MESEGEDSERQQTPVLGEATDLDASEKALNIDALEDLHQTEANRNKRRVATVYDAVAGE